MQTNSTTHPESPERSPAEPLPAVSPIDTMAPAGPPRMTPMRNAILGSTLALALLVPGAALAGSGLVALQSADPSCGDDSGNIYVDCGNGTVTDNRTGLVWLADADCFGQVTWHEAMEVVAGLADIPPTSSAASYDCNLSDGSLPGEWRLPTAAEWEVMMMDAVGEGSDPDCTATPPTITNDSGGGCWASGPSSFTDVQVGLYWSATTWPGGPGLAVLAVLDTGIIGDGPKTTTQYVWPVRDGQ